MDKLCEATEKKRNKLISKIIEMEQFKKDKKHLFELTSTELEYEYFRVQSKGHPHSSFGSIRLNNF